jgi:hypothetical protein
VAKQLLPLPACNDTPILHRTIRQLWNLIGIDGNYDPAVTVTIVGSLAMAEELVYAGVRVSPPGGGVLWSERSRRPRVTELARWVDHRDYYPDVQTLRDPGNSSLKGISRYLDLPPSALTSGHFDRRVVLLGDVVYSWACLQAILDVGPPWCMKFVGTSDLSRSAGELWGVSWTWEAEKDMRAALADAMHRHPPFVEYQCGQMRRWLWSQDDLYANRTGMGERPWFQAVDDFTKDIDVPSDLLLIPGLSERACNDDREHGVAW